MQAAKQEVIRILLDSKCHCHCQVSCSQTLPTASEGRVWPTDSIIFVLETTGSKVGDNGLVTISRGYYKN